MDVDGDLRLAPDRGRGRRAEGSAGEGARGDDGPLSLTPLTLSPLRGARANGFDGSHLIDLVVHFVGICQVSKALL
jgi:hypothetical protein